VGFDDHKQEVFNLVYFLKLLFLYTQSEKHSVEEYGGISAVSVTLWKHLGGSPRVH
jgi:hypothetical protein